MALRDELVEWFKRDPCAKEQFRIVGSMVEPTGVVGGSVSINALRQHELMLSVTGGFSPVFGTARQVNCTSCGANQTEVRQYRRQCAYCGVDR